MVPEHFVFDGIEAFLGDCIGERFLLREDELVFGTENADADFHRVGIPSVFLLGHAEIARAMQTEGVVKARQSAGIASRKGNDIEIAAFENQS